VLGKETPAAVLGSGVSVVAGCSVGGDDGGVVVVCGCAAVLARLVEVSGQGTMLLSSKTYISSGGKALP